MLTQENVPDDTKPCWRKIQLDVDSILNTNIPDWIKNNKIRAEFPEYNHILIIDNKYIAFQFDEDAGELTMDEFKELKKQFDYL